MHGLQILPDAVQKPGSAGREQGGEQWFQIQAGHAVDAGQAVRRRHLDQAQPGVIGLLPNELRVQRHQGRLGNGIDQVRQGLRVVDESF